MDDIRRRDIQLFLQELVTPMRLAFPLVAIGMMYFFVSELHGSWGRAMMVLFAVLMGVGFQAHQDSKRRRFYQQRFGKLWEGCQERHNRFTKVLDKVHRDKVVELRELPRTVDEVAGNLYKALRRADMVFHDVHETEKDMLAKPPVWQSATEDAQSQELYRIADKNIAEYKMRYGAVMAGVQRAEAQSAVFMTTLDTLRMKMLTYRVAGRSPEVDSHEFLSALQEAKMQLNAIDTALEELELSPFPKTVAILPPEGMPATPPPVPSTTDELNNLRQI
ncbi:MAG: hypothetical protein JSS72_02855 [Armatimonadetes bacterium]|nr:hypothetical protein [Armatimonadota bacterium]